MIVIGCKSASFRGAKKWHLLLEKWHFWAKIGAFVMILRPLVSRRNQDDAKQFLRPGQATIFPRLGNNCQPLMVQEIYSQGGLVTVVTVQNAVR